MESTTEPKSPINALQAVSDALAMPAFKQRVKAWIRANGWTQKQFALAVGVAHGTVRTWFSSDAPIGAGSCARIQKLLDNPPSAPEKVLGIYAVDFLTVRPYTPNTPYWLSAAQVPAPCELDFKSQVIVPGTKRFAQWCTPVINAAVRAELKKHTEADIQAAMQQIAQETAPQPPCMDNCPPSRDEIERMETGIQLHIPVECGDINRLFLAAAAQFAGKPIDDFVSDALNQAAETALNADLAAFLADD